MWCWCKHPSINKPLHSRWVFNQLFARVILRYFSTEVNTNHFDQLVPKQFTASPHWGWAKPRETGWKWCDSRRFHWISHRIRPTFHLEPCGNQLSDCNWQVSTSFPAGHAGIEAWRKGRKDMSWQKCEWVSYSVATSLLFLWSSVVDVFCSNIGFHSISHSTKMNLFARHSKGCCFSVVVCSRFQSRPLEKPPVTTAVGFLQASQLPTQYGSWSPKKKWKWLLYVKVMDICYYRVLIMFSSDMQVCHNLSITNFSLHEKHLKLRSPDSPMKSATLKGLTYLTSNTYRIGVSNH